VLFSRQPHYLDGFPINKKTVFESVVEAPLVYSLSREGLSATLVIPALKTGQNFFPHPHFPFFRLLVSFGIMPDLFWVKDNDYDHHPDVSVYQKQEWQSPWQPTKEGYEGASVELKFDKHPGGEQFSLLLAIAISYGRASWNGEAEAVKYVGAGRILKGV